MRKPRPPTLRIPKGRPAAGGARGRCAAGLLQCTHKRRQVRPAARPACILRLTGEPHEPNDLIHYSRAGVARPGTAPPFIRRGRGSRLLRSIPTSASTLRLGGCQGKLTQGRRPACSQSSKCLRALPHNRGIMRCHLLPSIVCERVWGGRPAQHTRARVHWVKHMCCAMQQPEHSW